MPRPLPHNAINSILVIQLGDIGDVVQSFPCLEAIANRYPQARLTVAVREKAAGLLIFCPAVHKVIAVARPAQPLLKRLGFYWRFFVQLRAERFDVVIDMRTDDRGAVLCAFSGAPKRIGFYANDGQMIRNRLFTDLLQPQCFPGIHINQYLFQILSFLGIDGPNPQPRFIVSPEEKEMAMAFLRQEGIDTSRDFICLQPFSLRQYKELTIEKYVQLIKWLRATYDAQIVIAGSPVERERATTIASFCDAGVWNLTGKTSINLYGAVLSLCRLFIGVDSAGQHIAAAAGVPTVIIYGPSQAEAWAPRGEEHLIVQKNLPCAPCRRMGCEDTEKSKCLETLTLEEIVSAIQKQMQRPAAPSASTTAPANGVVKPERERRKLSRNKWKIFIMCHNVIWDKMYAGDPDFSREHYSFLKLGNHDLKYNPRKGYHLLNEFDSAITLPKAYYAELTGMYCIYKNRLHKDLDYIGISHYDKEHRLIGSGRETNIAALEASRYRAEVLRKQNRGPTDITRRIDDALNSFPSVHISLESHDFNKIYNQRVLMDKLQPDQFIGEGRNCLDEIVNDYNAFFGTSYSVEDVAKDGFLNMCNCFVTPVYLFEKLMSFVTQIIESSSLDIYDSQRLYRLQGGLLERYVAVFFALESIPKIDFSITHRHWEKRRAKNNVLMRIAQKIFTSTPCHHQ